MSTPAPAATKTTASAVEVRSVTKTYEQWQRSGGSKGLLHNLLHPQKRVITALDDVSLQVQVGEFVAYAGANGAGKSTTIKLLCGMLLPDSGETVVLGLSPKRQRIELMRRLGILFGNRSELWWDHPVEASFEWKKAVWGIDDGTYRRMRELTCDLLGVGDHLRTFARELSLGQRMRCDLALMLLHRPELVVLDEPTLGLDVLAKRQMIAFLRQLNQEEHTTVLVTSHDMDDLEEMARRIVLLSHGKIVFDGDFSHFRNFVGCMRQLLVVTKSAAPSIEGATLMESGEGRHTYNLPPDADMPSMLRTLSALTQIEDVEFRTAPLEEAVAALYKTM